MLRVQEPHSENWSTAVTKNWTKTELFTTEFRAPPPANSKFHSAQATYRHAFRLCIGISVLSHWPGRGRRVHTGGEPDPSLIPQHHQACVSWGRHNTLTQAGQLQKSELDSLTVQEQLDVRNLGVCRRASFPASFRFWCLLAMPWLIDTLLSLHFHLSWCSPLGLLKC